MKNNVFRGWFESVDKGIAITVYDKTGKICKKHNTNSEGGLDSLPPTDSTAAGICIYYFITST